MSAPSSVIRIEGVTKRFGPVTAVDEVHLAFEENEFFALLGPSGCGKTTLLRLLAGFETPDAGRIWLDGADLVPVRPNRRPLNLMFQSYALFPHLDVWSNVAYGLRMERRPREEIARRVGEALEMVGLQSVARRRPEHISGGQRQRVALARALVKRPRVLLLDEPLAALDRKLRQQMQLELKRLQHEVGITFVVVTHDQEEAFAMADRIALFEAGRVAQVGSPRDIYERPRSHFVAAFVGEMNFFRGSIVADGLEVPGLGRLHAATGALGVGVEAWLGVRPEKLLLHAERPAGSALNVLAGRIESSTYLGGDVSWLVRVDGLGEPLRVRTPASAAAGFAEGAAAWCAWPADAGRLLE